MYPVSRDNLVCPYCGHTIEPAEAVKCPAPQCRVYYHGDCLEELGGCAVAGCANTVEVKKAELATNFWGATDKKCPYCAETIQVAALECPFCKAKFGDEKPVAREELLYKPPDPITQECRTRARWLMFFSVIGCTSPFALLFGYLWYRSNREEIERAGGTTRGLVITALWIAAAYLVLMALGLLAFEVGSPAK